MAARKVYLDTSVIGGYYDEEFKEETRALWKLEQRGFFQFVTSTVTLTEITRAPERIRRLFGKTFDEDSLLRGSAEADGLAGKYLQQKIVPEGFFDDAQHVAICTVAGVGLLASWNFRHLANLQRENAFNGVNLLQGYPALRILSPKALIYGHQEEV